MILQEKGDSDNTIESTVCQEILKCFQCITGSDKGSLRWLMEWTVQSIKTSTWWYWSTRELFFVCFLFFSCDAWANSGLGCVLSVLFTPPGEMLPLILFLVNCILCIWMYFSPGCLAWQNRVPVKRGVGVKAQLGLKASVRVRVRVDEGNQHFFPITARPGRGNAYFLGLLTT